jgi:ribose transport system permease protein
MTTHTATTPDSPTDARSLAAVLRPLRGTTFYVLCALAALVIVFAATTDGNFVSSTNIQSMGRNSAGLILVGVGLAFVLGSGNIDLSVGATLVLSSVTAAKTLVALAGGEQPPIGPSKILWPILLSAVVAAATGTLMGAVNGLLVTRLKINSFVVTLGTLGLGLGAAQVITDGANVAGLPTQLQENFGIAAWAGVPAPLVIAAVITAVAVVALAGTRFGRHTLAIGSSESGARRTGVRVEATTLRVFLLAGCLAGIAGFFDITRFGTTAISGHDTDQLQALSAVIIGGTSLFGGRASVLGAALATFIPVVLLNGFVMVGVPSFYQQMAIGLVLILAVWLDRLRKQQRSLT